MQKSCSWPYLFYDFGEVSYHLQCGVPSFSRKAFNFSHTPVRTIVSVHQTFLHRLRVKKPRLHFVFAHSSPVSSPPHVFLLSVAISCLRLNCNLLSLCLLQVLFTLSCLYKEYTASRRVCTVPFQSTLAAIWGEKMPCVNVMDRHCSCNQIVQSFFFCY